MIHLDQNQCASCACSWTSRTVESKNLRVLWVSGIVSCVKRFICIILSCCDLGKLESKYPDLHDIISSRVEAERIAFEEKSEKVRYSPLLPYFTSLTHSFYLFLLVDLEDPKAQGLADRQSGAAGAGPGRHAARLSPDVLERGAAQWQ